MNEHKRIVKQLKDSIQYRSEHKRYIEEFKYAIIGYFLEKYNVHTRVLTGVTWFAVELNYGYYTKSLELPNFRFTLQILLDFCKEFECEYDKQTCDGDRHIFTFTDVDMSNAFVMG